MGRGGGCGEMAGSVGFSALRFGAGRGALRLKARARKRVVCRPPLGMQSGHHKPGRTADSWRRGFGSNFFLTSMILFWTDVAGMDRAGKTL